MARRSSSKVPLAGHLPPDAPPAGETAGELLLLLERIAWDVPGAASAAFVRVRWPGGSGSAETVLCLAGGDGDVDAARLRVTTSQSSFTHWVKQRCGGVEVAVKDATQRYHLGSARLDLSELRFASVSKALSGVRLPILSGGKPRGYLTLTASLSFDKEGQEFVHHVSIPDIPDNMASLGKRAKSPEDLFLLLGDYVDRDQIKVQSLFSICDKDKSGSLDKGELAALLEQLLGCRPSVLEMRFFWDMLDLDADGRVTFSEFAFIVSDCRRARLSAKERTVQVQDLMRKLAVNILQSDDVSLADAFNEFDADQSGVLEHREVVAMIRSLMPGVSKREERLLLANMHEMDTDADGVISLQELEAALMRALTNALSGSGGRRAGSTPAAAPASPGPLRAPPQMKLQAASGLSPSQVKSRVGQFSAYASTAAPTPQRDSPAKMQSLTPPRASPPSPALQAENEALRAEVSRARSELSSREAEVAVLSKRLEAMRSATAEASAGAKDGYLQELHQRVSALKAQQEDADAACLRAWEGFKDSVGNFSRLAGGTQ